MQIPLEVQQQEKPYLMSKGVGIIDMIGLAQKGGAVLSHLRIGKSPDEIHSPRIASQGADLVIGGDLVVTGGIKTLSLIKSGTRREELLFDKNDLQKMNVLRRIIAPMGTMDAIEFINSKLKDTKNNAEFFNSMNKPA